MCYGNFAMGSPCPLLAGLKGASWGNTFMVVFALVLRDWKSCFALASSPQVSESLTNALSPWLIVLYVASGNFLLNSYLYFFSNSFFRSQGSGICFKGLKNSVSTLLIGFVVKFLASVITFPPSSRITFFLDYGFSSLYLQAGLSLSKMQKLQCLASRSRLELIFMKLRA